MNILQLLKDRFSTALEGATAEPQAFAEMVRQAQDAKFGDYQANFAMSLGKQLGMNPRDTAQQVTAKLDVSDYFQSPEIAGPGFINLTLLDSQLAQLVNEALLDERLGVPVAAQPKTVVVDFSSPNVAKPMHVGHLRSTVIGDAIVRTQRFLGNNVIADNHIGDWGTQFGMIIYGYKHFRNDAQYAADAVTELARLYRFVNQLCDYQNAITEKATAKQAIALSEQALATAEATADPQDKNAQKQLKKLRAELASQQANFKSIESKIASVEGNPELNQLAAQHPDIVRLSRGETAKLHQGDAENRRFWNEFLPPCLEALQRLYDRLDIQFDHQLGESYYDPQLPAVVAELEERGLATESAGAVCVFLEGHRAPFIIRKADGAYNYATTDLATLQYRVEEWKADQILIVVDARQGDHFKMLIQTAKQWKYPNIDLRHVPFGTVMGQDGKPYKTRSGDTVGLESLLDEAVAKALEIVSSNDDNKKDAEGNPKPELSLEQRQQIAEMVGIGGVKYADLMHNRESDYIFDADKMLAMNGNTATYLQYAHARIQGIFRRGEVDVEALLQKSEPIVLQNPAERSLALQIARYSETLVASAADSRPNLLAQYLYDLAGSLTSFYDQCPVLKAENEELRVSRLKLCYLSGRILKHGLNLLGISTPSQM